MEAQVAALGFELRRLLFQQLGVRSQLLIAQPSGISSSAIDPLQLESQQCMQVTSPVGRCDLLHHSALLFTIHGVALHIRMEGLHEALVNGSDTVLAHLGKPPGPLLFAQRPFGLATIVRNDRL